MQRLVPRPLCRDPAGRGRRHRRVGLLNPLISLILLLIFPSFPPLHLCPLQVRVPEVRPPLGPELPKPEEAEPRRPRARQEDLPHHQGQQEQPGEAAVPVVAFTQPFLTCPRSTPYLSSIALSSMVLTCPRLSSFDPWPPAFHGACGPEHQPQVLRYREGAHG